MKAIIAILLTLILATLGYMIWDKKQTEYRAEKVALEQAQSILVAEQTLAKREEWVAKAILEHRVEVGMTGHEARQAWGRDYQVVTTPPELRQFNIYREWRFDRGIVYLDLKENVVRIKTN